MFNTNPWLIAVVVVILAGVVSLIMSLVVSASNRRIATGKEELVGKTAMVTKSLEPEGTVFIKGEYWPAISESGQIDLGEEVIIKKVDSLKLYVAREK